MVLEYVNGGELFDKIVRTLSPYALTELSMLQELMKQTPEF
jgi:hypothetical protein